MLFSFEVGELERLRTVDTGVILRARLFLGLPNLLYALELELELDVDGLPELLPEYVPSKLNSTWMI
jgi:hypothetical protein